MNWKNFLKPDWKKILLTIVLAFMVHASFLGIIAVVSHEGEAVIFSGASLVFLLIVLIFFFAISCLFVYSIERILQKADKWKKWVFILLIPSIIMGFSMLQFIFDGSGFVIETYSAEMIEIAKDSQNDFICNFIIGYRRSHCFRDIAIEQNDSSLCSKIQAQNERNYCYYYAYSCDDIDYVSQDHTFSMDNCYLNRSRLEKDISICNRSWQILDGKEHCLIEVVKTTVDISICDLVENLEDTCKSTAIVAGGILDIVACREMREVSARNDCFLTAAHVSGDAMLCGEITNDNLAPDGQRDYRDYCYFTFATYDSFYSSDLDGNEYKGDYALCQKIESKNRKDRCFKEIAVSKGDASLCVNVIDEQSNLVCYRDIAIKKIDSAICDQIQDVESRDGCYYRVDMTKRALQNERNIMYVGVSAN